MAGIFRKNQFVGYSLVAAPQSQQLADIALVTQDLLNHFNTKKNERVMMPGWGCGIWDYLYEPFDSDSKNGIVEEVQRVIDQDPRVKLQEINVTELEYGLRVTMTLFYTPFNSTGTFSIDFDRRSQEL